MRRRDRNDESPGGNPGATVLHFPVATMSSSPNRTLTVVPLSELGNPPRRICVLHDGLDEIELEIVVNGARAIAAYLEQHAHGAAHVWIGPYLADANTIGG